MNLEFKKIKIRQAKIEDIPEILVVEKEALKIGHEIKEEPKYLRLCKKYGIEWEPMSDIGHQRFDARGALMFDLAADYAQQIAYSLDLPVFTIKGTKLTKESAGGALSYLKAVPVPD